MQRNLARCVRTADCDVTGFPPEKKNGTGAEGLGRLWQPSADAEKRWPGSFSVYQGQTETKERGGDKASQLV